MSEDKITREEMIALFGEEMPMEAVKLVWEAPDGWTLGQIRTELRRIAGKRTTGMSEELIEAMARGVCCPTGCRMIAEGECAGHAFAPEAQAAELATLRKELAAAREAALEEAACEADGHASRVHGTGGYELGEHYASRAIATAIRTLKGSDHA